MGLAGPEAALGSPGRGSGEGLGETVAIFRESTGQGHSPRIQHLTLLRSRAGEWVHLVDQS